MARQAEVARPGQVGRDRLLLRGLRYFGHHGNGEPERRLGSHFVIDLEVATDLAPSGASDRLADTIDYPAICALVQRITEQTECHLLEALATRIAEAVLALPGAEEVRVRVTKQPRLPAQTVGFAVEIVRP